jgi:carbamoyl-phosphate synthase small subunit
MSEGKVVLKDGLEFRGISFGAERSIAGEVVFNTGMVGYPEALTDPSYKGQILVLTYPLIGNYGVPEKKETQQVDENFESENIQISALIVSEYCEKYSHWDAKKSLGEWLKENDVPALYGIDTRALTKHLREKGAMLGKVIIDKDVDYYDPNEEDVVGQVCIKKPTLYEPMNGSANNKTDNNAHNKNKKIILVDCGMKNNMIHCLLKRGATVLRVPYDYDFTKEDYDGLVISNGPGDPKMCTTTIDNIKKTLQMEKPIFGICLGNQLLALAAGGDTYKLKYGHRSQNQPCIQAGTKRCFITTQNHGFAVDTTSLSNEWEPFFVNANDNTNEGIRHKTRPFFSVQFHPEARPGPVDTEFLFDLFLEKVRA